MLHNFEVIVKGQIVKCSNLMLDKLPKKNCLLNKYV